MNPGDQSPEVTPDRIMQFGWGYAIPLTIEAAIEYRVFDILEKGPKTVEQVSVESGASTRGLRPLMNTLVSVQLLAKDSQNRYSLAPESAAFLVTTSPRFQGGIFRHISDQLLPKWMQLRQVVRTGKPAKAVNQEGDGSAFFQKFVEDIFPMSYPAAKALGEALQISHSAKPVKVLDLAAGSGIGVIYKDAQKDYDVVRYSTNQISSRAMETVDERVKQVFGIKVRLDNREGKFRAGMVADVTFPKVPR